MTVRVIACALVAGIALISNVNSQDDSSRLPRLLPSSLIADIQAFARRRPRPTSASLVQFANKRLMSKGFEFQSDPCNAASTPTTIKSPSDYPGEVYHVYSSGGKRFLGVPAEAPCGCAMNLPITSISKKGAAIIFNRGSLSIPLPEKFFFEEVELVDAALRKTSRSWIVPDGGPPDGISADGTRLYWKIEKAPLYLEIGPGGALTFVPQTTPGVITRHTDLEKFPEDPDNAYLGYRRFSQKRKSFTVKFSHVCT